MKGLRFGRGPKTVDEYGFVVSAEASVPGGGWTSQHDRIKRAMAESAREMGSMMMITVSYIRTSGKHPNTIPSSITLSTQAA